MIQNAFIGHSQAPSEEELREKLGASKALWDQLVRELKDTLDLSEQEWNSYSPKAGWALRLKYKKRNIVYLSPLQATFVASFALGDNAMKAARSAKFPKTVVQIMNEARRYAEGTAIRIEVRTAADLGVIRRLAEIKMEN